MSMDVQTISDSFGQNAETAYPDKLLFMLYNGAVKNIENSERALKKKDFDQVHIQVLIARDIIDRLMANLPRECKETENLSEIYEYLQSKLVDADIKKDAGILEEVRSFMISLRDCWQLGSLNYLRLNDLLSTGGLTKTG